MISCFTKPLKKRASVESVLHVNRREETMKFYGRIARVDSTPLGSFAAVQSDLAEVFGRLVCEWTPSGREKMARVDAKGLILPLAVRRTLGAQPSCLTTSFNTGQLELSFNIGSTEPVVRIWVTIGGAAKVVRPARALLASHPGWVFARPV